MHKTLIPSIAAGPKTYANFHKAMRLATEATSSLTTVNQALAISKSLLNITHLPKYTAVTGNTVYVIHLKIKADSQLFYYLFPTSNIF